MRSPKRKFILGTDWWTDCDDAVALRLLTKAVGMGEIDLLGVAVNACMEHSVASVKSFLNRDGLPHIPVGIDREATDYGGTLTYQKRLAEDLPQCGNADGENAVELYRRLLAEADGKVELIEIGFLQVMEALLKSGGDRFSPKSGRELVAEKVDRIWVMGGKWDKNGEKEHNFAKTPRARVAAEAFCRLCPVPVTFLGWEVAHGVISGGRLDHSDHLYLAMKDHGSPNGRHSWDPMLVLMALIGDEEKAGYRTVTGYATVDPETGENTFRPSEDGLHRYVVRQWEKETYAQMIDERL